MFLTQFIKLFRKLDKQILTNQFFLSHKLHDKIRINRNLIVSQNNFAENDK